jgi:glucose/arabinose dehydrogenase
MPHRSGPATTAHPLALASAAALLLVLTACSGTDSGAAGGGSEGSDRPTATGSSTSSEPTASAADEVAPARVDGVLAEGLVAPWGMAFLPDGSALVSERDSRLVRRVTADGDVTDVGRVRGVDGSGEGGLLGIALSPEYEEDRTLFAYYTAGAENVVARLTYDGTGLSGQRRVFDGIPAGPIHDGGRIAFGPDGFLYVGTGEAGRTELSQDRESLGGKILRITADGRPAPGNPFDGSPVYSLGHRNVQGLAWDSRGQLWAAEFGQNEWDELNRIEAGGNYGWPVVEGRAGDDRFIDPVRQWATDKASPSGIAVAEDSVFMAGLRGSRLWRIPISGGEAAKPRALMRDFGRLRAVTAAPDGSLWVMTNNRDGRGSPRPGDDKVVRVTIG